MAYVAKRPIIDAGPGLNFFSINRERLLIAMLGPLSAPETVRDEILDKSHRDKRFGAAGRVLHKLSPKYMEILSDDVTPELSRVVARVSGQGMDLRMRSRWDLGETMVIAHAVVGAEEGANVRVLIDDGQGRAVAQREARRLDRLRAEGRHVGTMRLVGTPTVLEAAAGTEHIPDRGAIRDLYARLRSLDDGLLPIEATRLLSLTCWNR